MYCPFLPRVFSIQNIILPCVLNTATSEYPQTLEVYTHLGSFCGIIVGFGVLSHWFLFGLNFVYRFRGIQIWSCMHLHFFPFGKDSGVGSRIVLSYFRFLLINKRSPQAEQSADNWRHRILSNEDFLDVDWYGEYCSNSVFSMQKFYTYHHWWSTFRNSLKTVTKNDCIVAGTAPTSLLRNYSALLFYFGYLFALRKRNKMKTKLLHNKKMLVIPGAWLPFKLRQSFEELYNVQISGILWCTRFSNLIW